MQKSPYGDDFKSNYDLSQRTPEAEEPQDRTWFKSIYNTVRKYKKELFGDSDSATRIKKQRCLDYTIPPNYKLVFAKYEDGFYRPASIMGRSKKLQLFILYFYHTNRCCYVKPRDLFIRHGNLLGRKVCFCHEGQRKKGRVYGNNSPANHGFPSLFFIRRDGRWYKIEYDNIFLTKKQIKKIYFITTPKKKKSANSIQSRSSLRKSRSNL